MYHTKVFYYQAMTRQKCSTSHQRDLCITSYHIMCVTRATRAPDVHRNSYILPAPAPAGPGPDGPGPGPGKSRIEITRGDRDRERGNTNIKPNKTKHDHDGCHINNPEQPHLRRGRGDHRPVAEELHQGLHLPFHLRWLARLALASGGDDRRRGRRGGRVHRDSGAERAPSRDHPSAPRVRQAAVICRVRQWQSV